MVAPTCESTHHSIHGSRESSSWFLGVLHIVGMAVVVAAAAAAVAVAVLLLLLILLGVEVWGQWVDTWWSDEGVTVEGTCC